MGRYIDRGKLKVVFAPAVASKTAPTRAEINAGTVLAVPGSSASAAIADLGGWEFANSPADVPDANSDFDKQIPGTNAAGSPFFQFWDDDATTTIRTALAKGTNGFVIIMWYGDVPTKRCEVWPVTVASLNDVPNLGNTAHAFRVAFTATDTPAQNAVVPA